MKLKIGYQALIDNAMEAIETIPLDKAQELLSDSNAVFVDIRDVRELEREGMIPNALHAPRGMLEFWVDPDSPYYKPIFGEGKRLILYCASAWRSALATEILQKMGVPNVCHLAGGFNAWKKASLPTVEKASKPHSG
ncbi:rhodanese-like domain-containing protein [Polynucleobacter asymbioticus]|jgi:rhodanese-related sulfurtransferase|uniref:Rhodanese domain protein n=2 Tax=Polynucleobacter asymbioticus TaxID=576611 RepID=A4T005_POLAQ|nr:rhodanese-like domain-containing protein [Polynucleobacter asymbioticus]ABP35069.1 Rhodanese domain protein [Polynucleobacter asymbioticus QLW-P1DMWA-1]APB99730.1 rhodanese [Polynucleobacter asymbioticus]APC02027.1 rhodanese [Polynucleobacter asymbioticus]APC06837.1 rhodanese [Polynucleobacter asymbioticus]